MFAPLSGKILPSELLQELFFECVESVLSIRKRDEPIQHLSDNGSPMSSVKQIQRTGNEEEKSQVLMKFISKPSVMQSLYDLMFLERRDQKKVEP